MICHGKWYAHRSKHSPEGLKKICPLVKAQTQRAEWRGNVRDKGKSQYSDLRCYRNLRDSRRLVRSLGTLGGGNHFIEIDRAEDGTGYLVIHSGSRNLGKQVAEFYQHLAIDLPWAKKEKDNQQA